MKNFSYFLFSLYFLQLTLNLSIQNNVDSLKTETVTSENRILSPSLSKSYKAPGSICYYSSECDICCSPENTCVGSKEMQHCKEDFDFIGLIVAIVTSAIFICAFLIIGCIVGRKFKT